MLVVAVCTVVEFSQPPILSDCRIAQEIKEEDVCLSPNKNCVNRNAVPVPPVPPENGWNWSEGRKQPTPYELRKPLFLDRLNRIR